MRYLLSLPLLLLTSAPALACLNAMEEARSEAQAEPEVVASLGALDLLAVGALLSVVVAVLRPHDGVGGKLLAMAAFLLVPPTIGALAGLPVAALTPLAPIGILGALAVSVGVVVKAVRAGDAVPA